jgi:hypothetical protein
MSPRTFLQFLRKRESAPLVEKKRDMMECTCPWLGELTKDLLESTLEIAQILRQVSNLKRKQVLLIAKVHHRDHLVLQITPEISQDLMHTTMKNA